MITKLNGTLATRKLSATDPDNQLQVFRARGGGAAMKHATCPCNSRRCIVQTPSLAL